MPKQDYENSVQEKDKEILNEEVITEGSTEDIVEDSAVTEDEASEDVPTEIEE